MKEHVTKDGKSIPLNELADRHLENIIKKFEKSAIDGLAVFAKDGPDTIKDDVIYGQEALKALHYKDYVDELNSRKASQG